MDHLLVIDDDRELCRMLEEYLQSQDFRVRSVHTPSDGIAHALSGMYALVVLDVMLPGKTGFEVLGRIRASSGIPVLMLTARGDEVDRIVGLEIGADDYLAKPFSPRELVARIRAVLRRGTSSPAQTNIPEPCVFRMEGVELDIGSRRVSVDGARIELTAVEFDLLTLLMRRGGSVVSRAEISQAILKRRLHPLDRSIDVHISSLRRKLSERSGCHERIRTIRGTGYIFVRPSESK